MLPDRSLARSFCPPATWPPLPPKTAPGTSRQGNLGYPPRFLSEGSVFERFFRPCSRNQSFDPRQRYRCMQERVHSRKLGRSAALVSSLSSNVIPGLFALFLNEVP